MIYRLLRPGGLWINLGPLLYHWVSGESQDERYDKSVELSWEEVRHLILSYGFEILEERQIETTYSSGAATMLTPVYK